MFVCLFVCWLVESSDVLEGRLDDVLLTVWLVVNTAMANTLLGDASLCMRGALLRSDAVFALLKVFQSPKVRCSDDSWSGSQRVGSGVGSVVRFGPDRMVVVSRRCMSK